VSSVETGFIDFYINRKYCEIASTIKLEVFVQKFIKYAHIFS